MLWTVEDWNYSGLRSKGKLDTWNLHHKLAAKTLFASNKFLWLYIPWTLPCVRLLFSKAFVKGKTCTVSVRSLLYRIHGTVCWRNADGQWITISEEVSQKSFSHKTLSHRAALTGWWILIKHQLCARKSAMLSIARERVRMRFSGVLGCGSFSRSVCWCTLSQSIVLDAGSFQISRFIVLSGPCV